jgi:ABC-2 type transport system ATP-binding protein
MLDASSTSAIVMDRVSKDFGEVHALKSVGFSVARGSICALLGPNGAGKSTAVKILVGLLRATQGTAQVAGYDIVAEPLEVKRRIGYVPELGAVYLSLSANEYLTLVGALHDLEPAVVAQRSRHFLDLFGLSAAEHFRMDTLSKGMRQKVVLSAALLHDPEVIILDEPLSGLDANAVRVVKELLQELAARGRTILYCSHILEVVERLCDHLVILHEGSVVAAGPTAELVATSRRGSLDLFFRSLTVDDAEERRMIDGLLEGLDSTRAATSGPGSGGEHG